MPPRSVRRQLARIATDPTLGLADAITPPEPNSIFTPHWSSDQADDFRGRWNAAANAT